MIAEERAPRQPALRGALTPNRRRLRACRARHGAGQTDGEAIPYAGHDRDRRYGADGDDQRPPGACVRTDGRTVAPSPSKQGGQKQQKQCERRDARLSAEQQIGAVDTTGILEPFARYALPCGAVRPDRCWRPATRRFSPRRRSTILRSAREHRARPRPTPPDWRSTTGARSLLAEERQAAGCDHGEAR